MQKVAILFLCMVSTTMFAQKLNTSNKTIDAAFQLAVSTIDKNTREGILAAGADYGGEWTRDISINSWNGVNLLRPEVAKKSLWSVTINHDTIGHQYWDKILWAIGAYDYFKVNGDTTFLRQAYLCSKNTIAQLENTEFDKSYGLFMGPSVFNDGIAGYPEPIFEPGNRSSFVLDHKNSKTIKCLSTNCIYYGAYISIYEMGKALKIKENILNEYLRKATELKNNILKHFDNPEENKLNYLIDNQGKVDNSQEGLGVSFAVIFGVVDKEEAEKIISKVHVSSFGITSIYPDFPRYSAQQPGRHNNIVWPMVNGFWAKACKQTGALNQFTFELKNLAALAIDPDKDNNNFREIYNPYTGKPDGGWQSDTTWASCNHQTWSATAYISMVLNGLFGMDFENDGIFFSPYLPDDLTNAELNDLHYRDATLNIKIIGSGSKIKSFKLNGAGAKMFFVPATSKGIMNIEIELAQK